MHEYVSFCLFCDLYIKNEILKMKIYNMITTDLKLGYLMLSGIVSENYSTLF